MHQLIRRKEASATHQDVMRRCADTGVLCIVTAEVPTDLVKSTFEVSVRASNINARASGTHRMQVTLADQQADPNSPLYSIKTFEQLGL